MKTIIKSWLLVALITIFAVELKAQFPTITSTKVVKNADCRGEGAIVDVTFNGQLPLGFNQLVIHDGFNTNNSITSGTSQYLGNNVYRICGITVFPTNGLSPRIEVANSFPTTVLGGVNIPTDDLKSNNSDLMLDICPLDSTIKIRNYLPGIPPFYYGNGIEGCSYSSAYPNSTLWWHRNAVYPSQLTPLSNITTAGTLKDKAIYDSRGCPVFTGSCSLWYHPYYNVVMENNRDIVTTTITSAIRTDSISICVGDSVKVNNQYYYSDTTFTYEGKRPGIACSDTLITAIITVDSTYNLVVQCNNNLYTFPDGDTSSQSIIDTSKFSRSTGCDSVIITELKIIPQVEHIFDTIPCGQVKYFPDGDSSRVSIVDTSYMLSQGCSSTVVSHLHVSDYVSTLQANVCQSYYWPQTNKTYSSSGMYYDTLTSNFGCDSILGLDLTISQSYYQYANIDTLNANTCDGLNWGYGYQWKHYTKTGFYLDTVKTLNNCDSVIALQLYVTNKHKNFKIDSVTVCGDYKWDFSTSPYWSSGTYHKYLHDCDGCTLVIRTLELNLLRKITVKTDTVITCKKSISYTWPRNNNTYTSFGLFNDIKQNLQIGCDSAISLYLAYAPRPMVTTDTVYTCPSSYTWPVNNKIYNSPGYYLDTVSIAGCDSIVSLQLFFNPLSPPTPDTVISCSSYQWSVNGKFYSNSGTYKDTIVTTKGCDSIVSLKFTRLSSSNSTDSISSCNPILWIDGNTYASSNYTAQDTMVNILGCDSIVSLKFTRLNTSFSTDKITSCGPILWIDGNTYTSSNYTAKDTLIASMGCDSIVSLKFTRLNAYYSVDSILSCTPILWIDGNTYSSSNYVARDTLIASAGCDSIISLKFTRLNASFSTDSIASCAPILWIDGNTYSSSNYAAKDTFTNASGCDSIVSLKYTRLLGSTYTDSISSCFPILWIDGNTYSSSNYTAQVTFVNGKGCDSIISLKYTRLSGSYSTDSISSCSAITWINGVTYSGSNYTAIDTLTNSQGCDSIVSLKFTRNLASRDTNKVSICDAYRWFPSGKLFRKSGIHNDTLTASNGCDSILTLDLTIVRNPIDTLITSACDYYQSPSGLNLWTQSGIYMDTIIGINGCDSVIWIDLTLNQKTSSSINVQKCFAYTSPSGMQYSASGQYTDIISNAAGCDSIITINLTIDTANTQVSQSKDSLTANASPASYQWLSCDSTGAYSILAGEIQQLYIAPSNGDYAVEITENACVDTSACYSISTVGIQQNDFGTAFKAFPNPTEGGVQIQLGRNYHNIQVTIRNSAAQIVNQLELDEASQFETEIEGESGVYWIEIRTQEGNQAQFRVIVNR